MQKIGKIKEGQDCLVVSLDGEQSYVKIFNAGGELMRHSMNKGATELRQRAVPGEYKVETDGNIKKLSSIKMEIGLDITEP